VRRNSLHAVAKISRSLQKHTLTGLRLGRAQKITLRLEDLGLGRREGACVSAAFVLECKPCFFLLICGDAKKETSPFVSFRTRSHSFLDENHIFRIALAVTILRINADCLTLTLVYFRSIAVADLVALPN
jgi:hypothetical protein